MSEIELAIDFTHADAYLALGPTRALAQQLSLPLRLIPFRVELTQIEAIDAESSPAVRHQFVRNTYREMNVARYARIQGLPPLRSEPYEDSTLALKGLHLANQGSFDLGVDYATRIFSGYWHEQLNIVSCEVILGCLAKVGLEVTEADLVAVDLSETRTVYESKGVMSVPMYLVKGELFQGRQHLPWIRELLLQ